MSAQGLPPPQSKPKLVSSPRPSAKILTLPAPGSLKRLWRGTLRGTSRNPLASWAFGVASLSILGAAAWGLWVFLLRAGSRGAPWLDQAGLDLLGLDAGLADFAQSGRLAQAAVGLAMAIGFLLALRWVAWAALDMPMMFGSFATRCGAAREQDGLAAPLSPLSLGSLGLHLLCAILLWACVVQAGKIDLDALHAALGAKLRPLPAKAPRSNARDDARSAPTPSAAIPDPQSAFAPIAQ